MSNRSDRSDRRSFLAATGSGFMILQPQTAFTYQANSAVEIGLVGCGGRGNWITPFFIEYTGARVVALADVIQAHLERTASKFNVGKNRLYYGPDAYRELAQSKLDAVVIETPPLFHPEQAEVSVDSGKHVFLAKPVAVDVPGCKGILRAAEKARNRSLSFWVDFQSRAQPVFQEAAARVHRGDIGKPALAQVFYYAGRPSPDKGKPGMDEGQRRVMNFYMDREIGGDIIVEQNIHVIDMANWFLNGHPVKAAGAGGRTDWSGTPYDAGNAYDHFAITFWYPDGVHASFSSHQLTRSFADLCVRCFGIKGALDSHYGGSVRITGTNAWLGTEKDDTFRQGAINNVKAFVDSIRSSKPINNADVSVESNLTAILGRMAAYQEREITWDEMMRSTDEHAPELKLRW